MIEKEWTVRQLVNYLKNKLDNDFFVQAIWVNGEISNFTAHSSGHYYFTLKDEFARINCIMFANYAARLKTKPADGQKVLVKVNTSIYEKSGQIQLYVTDVTDIGMGILYQRFLELKEKLEQEGVFNSALKKPLPKYPFRIAVVTGKATAARQDVISTIQRRWPVAKIMEFNCLVQGEQAYLSIIEALSKADVSDADIIILARGGGSIEDLWSFNEETLIRFIQQLKTPLISGVGHETDTTLVDYISDYRAPTPTGAAEMATPSLIDVRNEIDDNETRIKRSILNTLNLKNDQITQLAEKKVLRNPELLTQKASMNLIMNIRSLEHYVIVIQQKRYQIENQKKVLSTLKNTLFDHVANELTNNSQMLNERLNQVIANNKQTISHQIDLLNAYSPLSIIKKGYAIIEKDDKVLRSIQTVRLNDEISIRLTDGNLKAIISKKEKNNERNEL